MADTTYVHKQMITIAKRLVRQAMDNQQDSMFAADAELLAKLVIDLDSELSGGAPLPKLWHDVQIAKALT